LPIVVISGSAMFAARKATAFKLGLHRAHLQTQAG